MLHSSLWVLCLGQAKSPDAIANASQLQNVESRKQRKTSAGCPPSWLDTVVGRAASPGAAIGGMTSYPAFSCPGHGQPCEVRTVTKAGSKHLGRPFYVCTASPQCKGWFQLADEPVRQPGKRVAVSIGTDVVVSATVCTDGGETQQKLHVEFSYDEAVVDACRGFAGAHYDPGSKGWRVPMRHRAALESRLAELQRAGTIRTLQTLQAPMQTMQGAPPSPSTSSVAGSKAAASPGAAASSSASALASASASSAAAPPPPSPASPPPASRPPPPPPALLLPPTL